MAERHRRLDAGLPSALKYRVVGHGSIAEEEHGRWSRAFLRWLQSNLPLVRLIADEAITAPPPEAPGGADDNRPSHSEGSDDEGKSASETTDSDGAETDHLAALRRRLFGAGSEAAAGDGSAAQLPTIPSSEVPAALDATRNGEEIPGSGDHACMHTAIRSCTHCCASALATISRI